MKFKEFLLLEQDPMMGGAPMGAPMGGAPMGDPMMGGAPPMGDPMMGGAPPMGDPMMGGAPMGGPPAAPTQQQIVIPKEADVWEVLDAILNNKPIEDTGEEQQPESPQLNNAPNQPFPPEANLLQPAGALMS